MTTEPPRPPTRAQDAARTDASFYDADGNPVDKTDPKAVYVEVTSYDADDNEIARTYGTVNEA